MTEHYKKCFERGLAFQTFAAATFAKLGWQLNYYDTRIEQLFGESEQGVEVKLDTRCLETGRLYIEAFEKADGNNDKWVRSGILKSDNTWLFMTGNEEVIWLFAKERLLSLYNETDENGQKIRYPEIILPTSRGIFLSLEEADKYCANKWTSSDGWRTQRKGQ